MRAEEVRKQLGDVPDLVGFEAVAELQVAYEAVLERDAACTPPPVLHVLHTRKGTATEKTRREPDSTNEGRRRTANCCSSWEYCWVLEVHLLGI